MPIESPLPSALSPSRLNDFLSCPRKYYYGAVERLPRRYTYASVKGSYVHALLEQLHALVASERTRDRIEGFVEAAEAEVLTPEVREGLALDDALLDMLRTESLGIVDRYFAMEDPRAVIHEGVEIPIRVTIEDTPLYGILDRLDRAEDGTTVIVDYKTGSVPRPAYETQAFANTELYAALCEAQFGARPRAIRLLYVAHGQTLERPVTSVNVTARRNVAVRSWSQIQQFYDDGAFPAKPSKSACRFCDFQDACSASGVNVVRTQ